MEMRESELTKRGDTELDGGPSGTRVQGLAAVQSDSQCGTVELVNVADGIGIA